MKLKIAILGSTGSIGKTLLKIILKDKKNFEIHLLSANKDYKTILRQAILFNVKNIILVPFKIDFSQFFFIESIFESRLDPILYKQSIS